jgi:two-component system, cell cycle sensor histidine kinase and response regulator CckA
MVRKLRSPVESVPKPQDPGAAAKNPAATPAPAQPPERAGPIENESRLEALIGSIAEIVFELARDGTFLNIWTTNEQLLYRPRHELKGKRVSDVIGEDFFRPFSLIFDRVLITGRGEELEYSLEVPAGKRWFLARMNRVPSADSDQHTLCLAVRDITERKHAEGKLLVSEEKFSKAFHLGPDAVTITAIADGRLLEVNDNFLRLTGYSRDEIIGRSTLELGLWANSKDRQHIVALLERSGEARDLEIRMSIKSGEVRTVQMSAQTIELAGQPCMIAIIRDVTERRALEIQLRQAQKMEAVGRLAGGVAHDFNNLLVGILGYSELLKKKLTEQAPLLRMANEINFAAMRARDLTSRLLALSHRQVLRPSVLDLNVLVRQCERLLRPIIGEDVHVILRLDPKTANVKADPVQLEQVILNLALNARDAMPGGGTLSMETCNVQVDAALARRHPALIPGSYVRLSVTDTGHGIAPDVMPRIFEPFFTTKEIGKGSGLGLSAVYGVVKQSGGCVTVSSEPEKGAAFGIYLPRASEIPERRIPAPPAAASSTGTETILLVEDEAVVRDLVCEILRESGYVVLSATSGTDAMKITADQTKPIDLLITDVVMPEMSGPELANTLRRARGEMRVLYMSGYTDDAVLVRQGLPENAAFIRKPYTPQQFLQKVRETLDASPRRAH